MSVGRRRRRRRLRPQRARRRGRAGAERARRCSCSRGATSRAAARARASSRCPGFTTTCARRATRWASSRPSFATLAAGRRTGCAGCEPPVSVAHPLDGQPAVLLRRSLDETAQALGPDARAYERLMAPLLGDPHGLLEDLLAPVPRPAPPAAHAPLRAEGPPLGDGPGAGSLPRRARAGALRGLRRALRPAARAEPDGGAGPRLLPHGPRRGLARRGGRLRLDRARAREPARVARRPHRDRPLRPLAGRFPAGARRTSSTRAPPSSRRSPSPPSPPPTSGACAGTATGRACSRSTGRSTAPSRGPTRPSSRPRRCTSAGRSTRSRPRKRRCGEASTPSGPSSCSSSRASSIPRRAPDGKHTGYAYCHVPGGSTVDLTEAIERQVERFAPGFRDRILARHVMNTVDFERYNPSLVGGAITGGVADLGQLFTRPVARWNPYTTPERAHLPLLRRDAAGRRSARHVGLLRGPRGATSHGPAAGRRVSLRLSARRYS